MIIVFQVPLVFQCIISLVRSHLRYNAPLPTIVQGDSQLFWCLSPMPECHNDCCKLLQRHQCNSRQCIQLMQQTNKQTQQLSYGGAYSRPNTSLSNSLSRMLLLSLFWLSIVTLVVNAEETFISVLDFSYDDLVSDSGGHASLDLQALAGDIPPSFTLCTAVMIKAWT